MKFVCFVTDKNYDVIAFIQNTFVLRSLRRLASAIFADIIDIVTIFTKTIFKGSKIVKRLSNYESKCNLYL